MAPSSCLSPPHTDLPGGSSLSAFPPGKPPPASLPPLQLAAPPPSQNARPGPGVIAAPDSPDTNVDILLA